VQRPLLADSGHGADAPGRRAVKRWLETSAPGLGEVGLAGAITALLMSAFAQSGRHRDTRMYGFPLDMDLSVAIGEEATLLCVGAHDLQITFGPVAFCIQSQVELTRDGEQVGFWEGGKIPDGEFLRVLNTPIASVSVHDERRLDILLEGGLQLQILDNSDQYESVQIYISGVEGAWII